MTKSDKKYLLDNINTPKDLKNLSVGQLEQLGGEIRELIIKTVSKTGGHLAPSLGVVELTLALHYVFNTPADKIIWDVGHQSYTHKIITGRKERFHTLRTYGGLSGFPKRAESPYDSFDTGHSSTSISAGLGISTAKALKGEDSKVIAVIGDGSMTGGMAFEGLNQAGDSDKDLIVVLNDNEMSIAPNVGAISSFLSRKMTGRRFISLKKDFENFLKSVPGFGENILSLFKKSEDSLITFFTPGMLFEAFKFKYIGPINGHRLDMLIETFGNVKALKGPILVHVLTKKGKGYAPAEKNPAYFHGVGCFEVETGSPQKKEKSCSTYTKVFGDTMVDLASKDEKIFAITAAMPEGTGLNEFARRYPDRFHDVGIAEQHAVTFAAGLATEGFKPVVAIYSTFLQRAFDQIIHDVCLTRQHVVFCLDRGGLVGEDGPTHHGYFDLTYMRNLPNMTVMAPKDENELRHMLYSALQHDGPVAIRYPRGEGMGVPIDEEYKLIPINSSAEILTEGKDLAIAAIGSMVYPAIEAAKELEKEGISATVINCRTVTPVDRKIAEVAMKTGNLLTVEENIRSGGLGGAVLEFLEDAGLYTIKTRRLALPDRFIEHGPIPILKEKYGLDKAGIAREAKILLGK
ncbi:MAG: 1-deoxy-D-xylulose-5-phosphate synthase [Deltaproteobacteria bacterium]|nr:1-deoxy-D-xylulose-5-phosphate synthase [Deltaproteobacteria bacterium]